MRYKDGVDPSSLMTTYFTSSTYVKNFIKEHGLPDVVEVRKIFKTKLEAKEWEERVIDKGRLYSSDKWLNKGNNNAFRCSVMDKEIRRKISESKIERSKKRGKRRYVNNGVDNMLISITEPLPDGYREGKLFSEKQLKYFECCGENFKDPTTRRKSREAVSKLKGKPKPKGHGENVSRALKGKPKPWNVGDKNPAKKESVRRKISESWKEREIGIWIYNPETEDVKYILQSKEDVNEYFSRGYLRGKPAKGSWYNDGKENIWVRFDSGLDTSNLSKGKLYSPKIWITNDKDSKLITKGELIPEGWRRGRVIGNHKQKQ